MLLNKLHVLDKGYVALVDSSCDSSKIAAIRDEFFGAVDNDQILRLANLTVVIKCPLFLAKSLGQYEFVVVQCPSGHGDQEAYIPTPNEVGSGDHNTDRLIADDIARTTEALLINPRAYQADNCNRFISQLITPINVYVTMLVSGSYNEWQKYCSVQGLPEPMRVYQDAVKQIMDAEWKKEHGAQEVCNYDIREETKERA